MPEPAYYCKTLGEVRLGFVGGSDIVLPTKRAFALLVYLAVSNPRPHARSDLTRLLWGETTSATRHSLSQLLYVIRRELPTASIVARPSTIKLAPGSVSLDIEQFKSAIAVHDYHQAIALYTGRFLEDLAIDHAPEFNEWLEERGSDLQLDFMSALRCLIVDAEGGGDWPLVETLARRHLEVDPYDESVGRSLVLALAGMGETTRASEVLHRIQRQQLRDLGRAPEVATVELGRRIANAPGVLGPPVASDNELGIAFIGRHEEFRQLRAAWTQVQAGAIRVGFVTGEPGIGKSRLAYQLMRLIALQGGRLFSGRCYSAERKVAYSGIADALLNGITDNDLSKLPLIWKGYLSEVVPELCHPVADGLARHPPELQRRQAFEAVARLLEAVSVDAPAALVLDDIQWGDEATIALVSYLTRRLNHSRVLILCVCRSDEASANEPLVGLTQSMIGKGYVEIPLRSLPLAAAGELIERLAEREQLELSDTLKSSIVRACGGRPFLLIATVREAISKLRETPAISITGPESLFADSIARLLEGQLSAISPDGKLFASGLAVLGKDAPLIVARAVADQSTSIAAQALQELIDKGVVIDAEISIAFAHDLLKEAVYRRTPEPIRKYLHGRAAAALADQMKRRPGTLASHYDRAGDRANAFLLALEAAEQCLRAWAHRDAGEFLEMAIRNAVTQADRVDARSRLADLRLMLRQYAEARALYETLVPEFRNRKDYQGLMAAQLAELCGEMAEGDVRIGTLLARSQRLLARTYRHTNPRWLPEVVRALVSSAHASGKTRYIQGLIPALLVRARGMPDRGAAADLLAIAANAMSIYATAESASVVADEAVAIARSSGDIVKLVSTLTIRGITRMLQGRSGEAAADYVEALAVTDEYGLVFLRARILINSGVLSLELGDYDSAEARFAASIEVATAQDRLVAYGNLAAVELERERWPQLRGYVTNIRRLNERSHNRWGETVELGFAGHVALADGRIAEADRIRGELLQRLSGPALVGDPSYAFLFLVRTATLVPNIEFDRRVERALGDAKGAGVFADHRIKLALAELIRRIEPDRAWHLAAEVRSAADALGAVTLANHARGVLRAIGRV